MYDSIVIGKGPAGLSAALYLGRDGYKVLVLGKDGMAERYGAIENYLGIESITGSDFVKVAEAQVSKVGVEIKREKVLKVHQKDGVFYINTDNNEYTTKSVVLALGVKMTDVKIKNLNNYLGKGVSSCVSCDGFFYKNKAVGVIGSSEYAIEEALNLKNYTDKITIFTNGKEMQISDKYIPSLKQFNIDNRKIQSVEGENDLSYIVFDDNEKASVDGVFIANDTPNIDDLSNELGVISQKNKVVTDENNITNVPGVFACGDMINSFKQVSTAVGSGAIAGNSCIKYLIKLNLKKE